MMIKFLSLFFFSLIKIVNETNSHKLTLGVNVARTTVPQTMPSLHTYIYKRISFHIYTLLYAETFPLAIRIVENSDG